MAHAWAGQSLSLLCLLVPFLLVHGHDSRVIGERPAAAPAAARGHDGDRLLPSLVARPASSSMPTRNTLPGQWRPGTCRLHHINPRFQRCSCQRSLPLLSTLSTLRADVWLLTTTNSCQTRFGGVSCWRWTSRQRPSTLMFFSLDVPSAVPPLY